MTQPHVPQNEPSVETPVGPFALSRNVWVVTLTSFLTDVSSEMIASVLPLYLSNVVGARTAAIGLIEGVAETTASLLKVFSGWFSDRIGRRKGLAVAGYGISTLAKACLLAAATWPTVLICRFGDRVGKGIRTAPRDALIADSTPARKPGPGLRAPPSRRHRGAVVGSGARGTRPGMVRPAPRVTQAFFSTLTLHRAGDPGGTRPGPLRDRTRVTTRCGGSAAVSARSVHAELSTLSLGRGRLHAGQLVRRVSDSSAAIAGALGGRSDGDDVVLQRGLQPGLRPRRSRCRIDWAGVD
ncbi:MAG: MFS transporter [Isosphaeraceae bacterium]